MLQLAEDVTTTHGHVDVVKMSSSLRPVCMPSKLGVPRGTKFALSRAKGRNGTRTSPRLYRHAADVLLANLEGAERGESARVKPKLVDNDQRLSEAIGSAEEGAVREAKAREFFKQHGIAAEGLSQAEVVRTFDRVKQVSIGAGCEAWSSLVY